MVEPRVERKLAAILAADIDGYSRLMEADEEGTHGRLRALRRELIRPSVAAHRGRIVKTTGDGALMESASVVDAVRCAVELQRGMIVRNAGEPQDRRIVFRMGVNLGNVTVDENDIYGDGKDRVDYPLQLSDRHDCPAVCTSAPFPFCRRSGSASDLDEPRTSPAHVSCSTCRRSSARPVMPTAPKASRHEIAGFALADGRADRKPLAHKRQGRLVIEGRPAGPALATQKLAYVAVDRFVFGGGERVYFVGDGGQRIGIAAVPPSAPDPLIGRASADMGDASGRHRHQLRRHGRQAHR